MADRKLTEQDLIDILEDIAGNSGNAAARIAAIKVLRELEVASRPRTMGSRL